MADPKLRKALQWSKAKRFQEAVKAVLDGGESQRWAATQFGVSRQALAPKVAAAKVDREEKVDRARSEIMSKAGVTVSNERRRVPDFWEFDRLYFSGLICPDCGVHHETPDFHNEMISAVESDARRVLINTPPYHSKSSLITVKHTIYDLVRNPNHRTIIVSASTDMAKSFVGQIQSWLEDPEVFEGSPRNLIDDWGPFKVDGQSKWNEQQFVVAGRVTAEKDPSVQALGWGKKIYGKRADTIKFDDIADNDNQANPEQVAKMQTWINKMALSRIGKTGKGIFVGTRISHGDIYSIMSQFSSYKWVRFSCILDDESEETLWPDHFPYSQALVHRDEMSPAEFQLVYQNVDIPGEGASFPPEMVEACKDSRRPIGHHESSWRLVAGLDPAGGNKHSGYTAITILAVDVSTGMRFLVASEAYKAMKAHQVKDRMLELARMYPISEWRVEANGLQSQIYQYDQELVRELALMGQKVLPHFTHNNKWDPQFGVESMAPFFHAGMVSIPWGNAQAQHMFQPLIEELIAFPMGSTSDRVMSLWFADLAAREILRRDHMPMFNDRATKNWPSRVKKRRRVVDFRAREVRKIPLRDQRPGHLSEGQANYRRMTVGQLTPHPEVREFEDQAPEYANVPGSIDEPPWQGTMR